MSICLHVCMCPQSPEEGIAYPDTELPVLVDYHVGAGNQTQVSALKC